MSLLPSSSPLSHEMLSEKSTHVFANASTILVIQNRHRMGAVLPILPMYFGRPNSKSDIGPYWTNGAPYDVNLAGHLVQLHGARPQISILTVLSMSAIIQCNIQIIKTSAVHTWRFSTIPSDQQNRKPPFRKHKNGHILTKKILD